MHKGTVPVTTPKAKKPAAAPAPASAAAPAAAPAAATTAPAATATAGAAAPAPKAPKLTPAERNEHNLLARAEAAEAKLSGAEAPFKNTGSKVHDMADDALDDYEFELVRKDGKTSTPSRGNGFVAWLLLALVLLGLLGGAGYFGWWYLNNGCSLCIGAPAPIVTPAPVPVDLTGITSDITGLKTQMTEANAKLDTVGQTLLNHEQQLTDLGNTVEANTGAIADLTVQMKEAMRVMDIIRNLPRPPDLPCKEVCDPSIPPTNYVPPDDSPAVIVKVADLPPPTVKKRVVVVAPMICPDEVAAKCGRSTADRGCSIEVKVDSGGEPFFADITAWADGRSIDQALDYGPFKPHDGVMYLPVDCAFAGGDTGQVCMGQGTAFAWNLDSIWFVHARKSVANPTKVDPQGRIVLNPTFAKGGIKFS